MKKIIALLFFIFFAASAHSQQVSTNIKSLLSTDGKVLYGDEPNSLVVIDYPENLQRVEQYLSAIDVAPRQVLIEARVVEVKLQKENSLGINWNLFATQNGLKSGNTTIGSVDTDLTKGSYEDANNPFKLPTKMAQYFPYKPAIYPPLQSGGTQDRPFTFAIFDANVNVVLETLATSMNTNILSAPRVTTVNNREAEIKVVQRLPWAEPEVSVTDSGAVSITWTIHFEEVGITLKATPTINDDGTITMVLNPSVSEKTSDYSLSVVQGTQSVPYTVPVIDTRSASTKVVIGNGQTLIIGGLIKDKVTKGETKVPFLGDLPGVGYLFKNQKTTRDKTELLIFVSPTIITGEEVVHMQKQERYGAGKTFVQEREREEQMLTVLEKQEKGVYEKLNSQIEALSRKQESLVEERKKIEGDVNKRRENLKTLQETQSVLEMKRKQLQQKKIIKE